MPKFLKFPLGSFRTALCLLAIGVATAASSLPVNAATLPVLPQIFDASYVAPAGHTINVGAGGDLQAALNQAQLGDTIILQAGARFAGPFKLPNKTSGNGWVYVQSGNYAQLPAPGTRVSQTDTANMPTITAPAGGQALVTVDGSHHFRFVGVAFKPAADVYVVNIVQLGNNDKTAATLPHHVTFDRCYFEASATRGTRRGLLANAAHVAVVDSVFSGFGDANSDSQAILAFNTSGPIKIENNQLEGAGENVMFGGADSAIPALIPADIEIRGNHFVKPLAWFGGKWVVKNLLEFKAARRVLVTGNTLENSWAAAQAGFAVLVTPRNQEGTASWSITEDITFTNNRIINAGSGFSIVGTDNLQPSQHTSRILIKNNMIEVNGLYGASGWGFMVLGGPADVTVDHNTIVSKSAYLEAGDDQGRPKVPGFSFTNNIAVSHTYGLIGSGTGPGIGALNTFFSTWTMTNNVVTVGPESAYPSGNFFPANADQIGFANAANGNYALLPTSPYRAVGTDGKDPGADWSLLPGIASSQRAAVPQAPQQFQVH